MQPADIRKKIHQAIQAHVKNPAQFETRFDPQAEPFLVLKSTSDNDIEISESDGDIELFFGLASENFSFNPDLDEDDESGEGGDLPNEQAVLLEIAKTVKGLLEEKLFAAEYTRGSATVNGIYEAREFPDLAKKPDFVSLSWSGKWTRE